MQQQPGKAKARPVLESPTKSLPLVSETAAPRPGAWKLLNLRATKRKRDAWAVGSCVRAHTRAPTHTQHLTLWPHLAASAAGGTVLTYIGRHTGSQGFCVKAATFAARVPP